MNGLTGVTRASAVAVAFIFGLAACAAADRPAPEGDAAPTSALGSYLAARHAQQEHDYARAAQFMNRTLAEDPGNFDLIRHTFVLRVSEGRVADATPLALRISDLDRNSGLAELVLLLQDVKAGQFESAANRAHALPGDGAQRLAAPLMLAWAEMGRGRPAPALQALDGLSEVRGLQGLKDLHTALLADYAGRIGEADEAYKKLVGDMSHMTWRAVETAGNFYERHSRTEEARRIYERFAADDVSSDLVAPALARIAKGQMPPPLVASARDGAAEGLFDLATLFNQRETTEISLLYARLALDLRPNFPIAQVLIGELEEQAQHTAEAVATYRTVDPASPLLWSARLRAATALDALDRTEEAAQELRRMAAEQPDRPEPLVELGDILRGRSRFAEAITAYGAAIERVRHQEPRDWRLFYSRGVAFERSGDWPRAEADLRHARELQPDQPLVLNYLGYSWIERGVNLDDALKMVQRAVELRPNDGYIVDSLGWAFYRLGEFSSASQLLERAIELLPQDPTINDHLGDAYWQTGRRVEARYQWRRALQFQPEADQVKTIETKLDRGLAKLPAAATARGG